VRASSVLRCCSPRAEFLPRCVHCHTECRARLVSQCTITQPRLLRKVFALVWPHDAPTEQKEAQGRRPGRWQGCRRARGECATPVTTPMVPWCALTLLACRRHSPLCSRVCPFAETRVVAARREERSARTHSLLTASWQRVSLAVSNGCVC
jgi:hypothetical protein